MKISKYFICKVCVLYYNDGVILNITMYTETIRKYELKLIYKKKNVSDDIFVTLSIV